MRFFYVKTANYRVFLHFNDFVYKQINRFNTFVHNFFL